MNASWASPASWLLHTAVGGGAILFLSGMLMRWTRQPAQRQRLGEIGLAAALVVAVLSLGPPWLHLPVTWDAEPFTTSAKASSDPPALAAPTAPPVAAGGEGLEDGLTDLEMPPAAADSPDVRPGTLPNGTAQTPAAPERPARENLAAMAVGGFILGSVLLLGRWLLGHLALGRLLRSAGPAPEGVARLFASMAGRRPPRLLVSRRLRVPISCGLWRPTVVLPARLCDRADVEALRWVFAHELTHLERRDAWSCWLFGLGQAVYYYLPWFWGLRRQVRLCQEYVADAAVTEREAGAADYAEFLLTLTRRPALPVGATGVLGNASDLFRRVTMLLQEPLRVEKRCPRRWSLAAAGSLLALAVLASGIGLGGPLTPAAADEPATEDVRIIVVPNIPQKAEVRKDVRIRVVRPATGDVIRIFKDIQIQAGKPGPDGQVIQIIKFPADKRVAVERLLGLIKVVQERDQNQPDKRVAVERLLGQIRVVQERDQKKDAGKRGDPNVEKSDVLKGRLKIRVGDALKDIVIDPNGKILIEKDVARLVDQLQALEGKVQVDLATDNADLQKEIQKAIEQIKLQQQKLDKLRKMMMDQRARAARLNWPNTGRLGVQLAPPGAALADQLDLPRGQGLVVTAVVPDSAAARGGLKANDILLEAAGKPVGSDPAALSRLLAALKPGAPFDVVVLRKGKKETLKGLLAEGRKLEARQQPFIINQGGAFPRGGIRVIGKGNNTVLTTVVRTDDKFTTRYQEGNLIITLTGTVADGKAKVAKIYVQEGSGQVVRYDGVDKVPEQYQGKVKNLIEMSEKGQVKVEIKQP